MFFQIPTTYTHTLRPYNLLRSCSISASLSTSFSHDCVQTSRKEVQVNLFEISSMSSACGALCSSARKSTSGARVCTDCGTCSKVSSNLCRGTTRLVIFDRICRKKRNEMKCIRTMQCRCEYTSLGTVLCIQRVYCTVLYLLVLVQIQLLSER